MGQLVSSEVLPKVAAELKKSALAGGAFEQALKGLRVTEGQMMTDSQRAGNIIFKSGFEEGLSSLYKTISEILKTSGPQLEKLGKIFGNVFKGIAYSLKLLEPVMKFTINNFELLFGVYAFNSVHKMTNAMERFGKVTRVALLKAFLPITAALYAAEELIGLFSDKIVTNKEMQWGHQVNLGTGKKTDLVRKDGKLYMDTRTERGMFYNDQKPTTKEDFYKMNSAQQYDALQGPSAMSLFANMAKETFFGGLYSAPKSASEAMGAGKVNTPSTQNTNTFIFQDSDMGTVRRALEQAGISGMSTTK